MIMITDSEATTYCLVMAQVVPTLLIALFVLDRNQLLHDQTRLIKKVTEWEQEVRAEPPDDQPTERDLEAADLIKNSDTVLAVLESIDPSKATEDVAEIIYQTREEIKGFRDSLAEAQKRVDQAGERLQASRGKISAVRLKAEAELPKAEKKLFRVMALVIIYGVVAEVIMLWAALGLMPVKIGLGWATSSVIVITASLAGFAMHGLAPRPLGTGFKLTISCLLLPLAAAIGWSSWLISTAVTITR